MSLLVTDIQSALNPRRRSSLFPGPVSPPSYARRCVFIWRDLDHYRIIINKLSTNCHPAGSNKDNYALHFEQNFVQVHHIQPSQLLQVTLIHPNRFFSRLIPDYIVHSNRYLSLQLMFQCFEIHQMRQSVYRAIFMSYLIGNPCCLPKMHFTSRLEQNQPKNMSHQ